MIKDENTEKIEPIENEEEEDYEEYAEEEDDFEKIENAISALNEQKKTDEENHPAIEKLKRHLLRMSSSIDDVQRNLTHRTEELTKLKKSQHHLESNMELLIDAGKLDRHNQLLGIQWWTMMIVMIIMLLISLHFYH